MMQPEPLPTEKTALKELFVDIRFAKNRINFGSDRLNRFQDAPGDLLPATLLCSDLSLVIGADAHRSGAFGNTSAIGIVGWWGSGEQLNYDLSEVAKLALPLLKYTRLSLSDRVHIEQLGRDCDSELLQKVPRPSLRLEDMLRWSGEPKISEEVTKGNQTRLLALRGLFDRLTGELEELSSRVNRKFDPPGVKERVRVDVDRLLLTIDGTDYSLKTRMQALILDQLAKADGTPLSGTEIAKRLGLQPGLAVSRSLAQVMKKHPQLSRYLPLPSETDNKFCFRLPPRPGC